MDPGLQVSGWGIVVADGDSFSTPAGGAIKTNARHPDHERLLHIYRELCAVIGAWQPAEVAVEEPFVGANIRSAFAIGQARAVALLAAAQAGLPVRPYAPAEVKLAVTGHGRSDKAQVQELVRVQLALDEAPSSADTADALAVAICHHLRRRADARLAAAR